MKSKLVVLGKSFLITVMTIQIIFGMVYFFLHWNNMSAYYETSEILSIAESGVYDEYTDYLYPVLIRGYLQIQQLFSLSSFAFVYSVQAIVFIFSVFKLLGQLRFLRRNYIYHHLILRIFLSFYIFSFPIILQMVMSILPNILSLSIVLLVIGICVKRQPDFNNFIQGIIGVIVIGLFMQKMMWILLLSLTLLHFYSYMGRKKRTLFERIFLLFALFFGIVISIFHMVLQTPGSRGHIQESKEVKLMQAYIYPDYLLYYPHFSDEVHQLLTKEEADVLSQREANLFILGQDIFEENKDYNKAHDAYVSILRTVFEMNTKNTIMKGVDNLLDYYVAPITILDNFQGNSKSMTGWNYGRWQGDYPTFSQIYMKYSIYTWILLFSIALSIKAVTIFVKRKIKTQEFPLLFSLLVVVSGLFYGIFGSTSFDYKNTLLLITISLVYIIIIFFRDDKNTI